MEKPDPLTRAEVTIGQNANLSVRDLVAQLEALADGDRVSLFEIVESWGRQSFLPILLVLALMVFSPLSGVPLFSSFSGIMIALVSLQMLLQRDSLWLPNFIGRQSMPGHRLRAAFGFMRRVAGFFDRCTRAGRLHRLVDRRGRIVTQALSVVSGALMPIMEIVPFSSSILAVAVLCFALSLLTRDGLLAVVGVAILSVVAFLPALALDAVIDGPRA